MMIKTHVRIFAAFLLTALSGCMFTGNPLAQQHTTYAYALGPVTSQDMQLTLSKAVQGNFEGLSLPSEKEAEDPFALANNRWRIPATHKETDAEIRQRLSNHCRFWQTYFAWALDKNLATVDVRSTPMYLRLRCSGRQMPGEPPVN